jgi:hypothetical protein
MKSTLLQLLKYELAGEPAPEGWYTINELMDKLGGKRTAVEGLVKRKGWEVRKFRTITKDGKAMNANHYHTGKL